MCGGGACVTPEVEAEILARTDLIEEERLALKSRGYRVKGIGLWVKGLGFRVWCLGFGVVY